MRRYRRHLLELGHTSRLKVIPPGEGAPIYSDLWDESTDELVEAKSSVTRDQIRKAVGQLLDYGRFVHPRTLTILVPRRPRADLVAYANSLAIDIGHESDSGRTRVQGPPRVPLVS